MRQIITGVILGLALTTTASAQESEGRALAELSFETVDRHEKGYLHLGDMEVTREEIFSSMDADESNSLELSEFLSWGYGFDNIAEDEGKLLAYRTALKVVYRFWDRNGDGKITPAEHRRAVNNDFFRADLNNNAILEKSEFLGGFSILVAIRAALKPE